MGREGDLQNEMTETDNSLIEQTWMDRDMIVADLFYTNSHVIICWSGLRVVMEDTNSVLDMIISEVVAAKSTAYTPGESCRAQYSLFSFQVRLVAGSPASPETVPPPGSCRSERSTTTLHNMFSGLQR